MLGAGCSVSVNSAPKQDSDDPTLPLNIKRFREIESPPRSYADNENRVPENERGGEKVYSYGANIFYFASTRAEFGNKLYHFLKLHPEKEVTAMTPDIVKMYGDHQRSASPHSSLNGDWGGCVGYFVTFRDKTPAPKATR